MQIETTPPVELSETVGGSAITFRDYDSHVDYGPWAEFPALGQGERLIGSRVGFDRSRCRMIMARTLTTRTREYPVMGSRKPPSAKETIINGLRLTLSLAACTILSAGIVFMPAGSAAAHTPTFSTPLARTASVTS